MKPLEYEIMPLAGMEWLILDSEENHRINSTLKVTFQTHPEMAHYFVDILISGKVAKYGPGHMIRLATRLDS